MSYKIDLVGVAGGFSPICEGLPGFRGCAPRRRGSGQANKAERIGTACRGDSWSDLAWERGEGFPLLIQYFIYFAQNVQNHSIFLTISHKFLYILTYKGANYAFRV